MFIFEIEHSVRRAVLVLWNCFNMLRYLSRKDLSMSGCMDTKALDIEQEESESLLGE